MDQPTVLRDVRVFDGAEIIPNATVVVRNGVIDAVDDSYTFPPSARVTQGNGGTLLPGLIDSHTHVYGAALHQALVFGVTTELDMFADHRLIAKIKRQQAAELGQDMADLRSSGTLVTAPGGHGTEWLPIPTINGPDEAQAFVDERIAEGSDYIKIVYDDSRAPSIDKSTLAAVVDAAHKRGRLAIVHILTLAQARDAIEAGADGLAHLFIDRFPDPDFGRLMAEHDAFVVPTLTLLEGLTGTASGTFLVNDPHLAPYVSDADALSLHSALPLRFQEHTTYEGAEEAVRLCRSARVPILAGTDAPNPGTLHGASMHRELELLVRAGLTPSEALAAGTSVPATVFGLQDRGRIRPGLRADLLLVEGDPTTDITVTRNIVGVWKRGVPIDRQRYEEAVAQQKSDTRRPLPRGAESGWVSDFEGGALTARFGFGWRASTDGFRGGASTAELEVVDGGALGSKGSLLVVGEVAPGLPFAWAGAIFFPGPEPWLPANLSTFEAISFWAKGDGSTYRLVLFAHTREAVPASVTFVAASQWREHIYPLSRFNGVDGRELLAVAFTAGPAPGKFSFQIDDVRFR